MIELAARMQRLPRHLGIHSGGMVICDRPVGEVCPVEWARMPGRSVLQWDKDDCAYAGLVKFDLLGLGMLTALRDCFELVEAQPRRALDLHSIPQEDPGVYDMLCEADTVGVFQVESRAQMATLPRLRPRKFYDLVVEVALIRPGPIQGGSVHPYMRRRHGDEPPTCRTSRCAPALGKTLGVPLFQEQMMQLAIDCAGFSPAEADRLRQAMSAKRGPERIEELRDRLLDGMADRGIPAEVAEDIYAKILAFSSYGFPESHAISFAYLVYASAWLKCYYPAAFTAALLRAQPMGFYSPGQPDQRRAAARRRGARRRRQRQRRAGHPGEADDAGDGATDPARPPAGRCLASRRSGSAWPWCGTSVPAAAEAIEAGQPYRDLEDFARRTRLPAAGAGGAGHRGRVRLLRAGPARGAVGGRGRRQHPARAAARHHARAGRAAAAGHDRGRGDVRGPVGHRDLRHPSDRAHPAAAGRAGRGRGGGAGHRAAGRRRAVAGLVTHRQQPGTARGVVFLSLEDETGIANVDLPAVGLGAAPPARRCRASALLVHGRVERWTGRSACSPPGCGGCAVVAAARSRDFR